MRQEGVTPETINKLPLVVAGGPRNSAQMAVLLPGVNTGSSPSAYDARINGGLKSGDEAVMDGVSMQEGTMSQGGMVAFWDFRMTPDMISEFRVMTSTYSPEYGDSTGGQIIVTTRSGTDQFHGAAFEYLRNKSLNALQFTNDRGPGDQRPKDNEHEFGFSFGGPLKIPKIYHGDKYRTYFFTDIEFFRIAGGASRHTISIPLCRSGRAILATGGIRFTTRPRHENNPTFNPNQPVGPNNLQYLRDQFPDNVIPANRAGPVRSRRDGSSFCPTRHRPALCTTILCRHRCPIPFSPERTTILERSISTSAKLITWRRRSGVRPRRPNSFRTCRSSYRTELSRTRRIRGSAG